MHSKIQGADLNNFLNILLSVAFFIFMIWLTFTVFFGMLQILWYALPFILVIAAIIYIIKLIN